MKTQDFVTQTNKKVVGTKRPVKLKSAIPTQKKYRGCNHNLQDQMFASSFILVIDCLASNTKNCCVLS
jgi:hypothetical protein